MNYQQFNLTRTARRVITSTRILDNSYRVILGRFIGVKTGKTPWSGLKRSSSIEHPLRPVFFSLSYQLTRVLISPLPDLLADVFCLMVRIFRLMLVLLYI